MQDVSNTVKELVNGLAPITLSLNVYGEEPVNADIIRCVYGACCNAGDHFSIGNACPSHITVTLAAAAGAESLYGKRIEVKWAVKNARYPLFTGYVTRETMEAGCCVIEAHDALYLYGNDLYRKIPLALSAYDLLNGLRDQLGGVQLDSATSIAAQKLTLDADNIAAKTSCLDVLAMVAGAMGGNAVIKRDGTLAVTGYRQTGFDTECYAGEEAAERTGFTVTGLSFVKKNQLAEGTEAVYSAGDGSLRFDNDLATQAAVDYAYGQLEGLSFRAGSFSIPGGLLLEPGDLIRIDNRSESYLAACMDLSMTIDGGVRTAILSYGEAEPGGASGSINKRLDAAAEEIGTVRVQVAEEKTEREKAIEKLGQALADAGGLYTTTVTQPDGSNIYYLHNKSTLKDSVIVIKLTADALGASTDGGQTYPVGITVSGEAILKILAAEGINADWIRTGSILVTDASGSIILKADADTGQFIATEGKVGNWTIDSGSLSRTTGYREVDSGGNETGRGSMTVRLRPGTNEQSPGVWFSSERWSSLDGASSSETGMELDPIKPDDFTQGFHALLLRYLTDTEEAALRVGRVGAGRDVLGVQITGALLRDGYEVLDAGNYGVYTADKLGQGVDRAANLSNGAVAAGESVVLTPSANACFLVVLWSHAAAAYQSIALVNTYSGTGHVTWLSRDSHHSITQENGRITLTGTDYRWNYTVCRL